MLLDAHSSGEDLSESFWLFLSFGFSIVNDNVEGIVLDVDCGVINNVEGIVLDVDCGFINNVEGIVLDVV